MKLEASRLRMASHVLPMDVRRAARPLGLSPWAGKRGSDRCLTWLVVFSVFQFCNISVGMCFTSLSFLVAARLDDFDYKELEAEYDDCILFRKDTANYPNLQNIVEYLF